MRTTKRKKRKEKRIVWFPTFPLCHEFTQFSSPSLTISVRNDACDATASRRLDYSRRKKACRADAINDTHRRKRRRRRRRRQWLCTPKASAMAFSYLKKLCTERSQSKSASASRIAALRSKVSVFFLSSAIRSLRSACRGCAYSHWSHRITV